MSSITEKELGQEEKVDEIYQEILDSSLSSEELLSLIKLLSARVVEVTLEELEILEEGECVGNYIESLDEEIEASINKTIYNYEIPVFVGTGNGTLTKNYISQRLQIHFNTYYTGIDIKKVFDNLRIYENEKTKPVKEIIAILQKRILEIIKLNFPSEK